MLECPPGTVILGDYIHLGYAVIRVDVMQGEVDDIMDKGLPNPNHPDWRDIIAIDPPDNTNRRMFPLNPQARPTSTSRHAHDAWDWVYAHAARVFA